MSILIRQGLSQNKGGSSAYSKVADFFFFFRIRSDFCCCFCNDSFPGDSYGRSYPQPTNNLRLLPLRLNLSLCWKRPRKWPSYKRIIYWNAGNLLCLPENNSLNISQHELKAGIGKSKWKPLVLTSENCGRRGARLVFCPLIVLSNRRHLLSFRGPSYLHYDWMSWPVAMSDDREVKTEERPFKVLRFENDTFALTRHATGAVRSWSWLVSWHGWPNYSSTKANIFFFYPDMNGSFPPFSFKSRELDKYGICKLTATCFLHPKYAYRPFAIL